MHELSVVMGIVSIATEKAREAEASVIDEIELDIGKLSNIEMDAFEFAWEQGVKETMLENTVKTIHRIEGKAKCLACKTEFAIEQLYDPCPVCGQYASDIIQGKELRIKSLVVN
ncbi:MAG: hydrogenase maturation nickel metallochaperone HypA [Bacteroidota bacterium]|nr:hydrogenase maturation nickel metallochaperone HypA [Bacteroidota bacterium]